MIPKVEQHFPKLNNQNMTFYMAVNYNDFHSEGTEDFVEDLKRIKYIKRLLSSHADGKALKIRLMLNHCIVLVNQFGSFATARILFYKLDAKFHDIIATVLYQMNALHEDMESMITLDQNIIKLISEELNERRT